MTVLPLGWTGTAYELYRHAGDRSQGRGRAPRPRPPASIRPGRLRARHGGGRAERYRGIEVPLGWTGNAYRRAGRRGV